MGLRAGFLCVPRGYLPSQVSPKRHRVSGGGVGVLGAVTLEAEVKRVAKPQAPSRPVSPVPRHGEPSVRSYDSGASKRPHRVTRLRVHASGDAWTLRVRTRKSGEEISPVFLPLVSPNETESAK